jgi:hypothetical protein
MKILQLGPGVAPAVSWYPNGWHVAIGGIGRVILIDISHDGINRGIIRSFPDGFGFPSLSGGPAVEPERWPPLDLYGDRRQLSARAL